MAINKIIILFAHPTSIIQDLFKFMWRENPEDGAPPNHHRIRAHIENYSSDKKRIVFSLDKTLSYSHCDDEGGICSDAKKHQHLCALFSGGLSNILINSATLFPFLLFCCVLGGISSKDLITPQISIIFDNLRELSIKSPYLHPVFCLWAKSKEIF